MTHKRFPEIERLRTDFPQCTASSYIYLDSAATAYKPSVVIDTLSKFYSTQYATVHRSIYQPSLLATDLYEQSRAVIGRYINASSPAEVIFTKGTTDSINIIADSMAHSILTPSSKMLVSEMEHHSNLIPWQLAAKTSGASLEPIPITPEGTIDMEALEQLLSKGNVAVVALTHCSNALGTINPIAAIAALVHAHHAPLVVDGAQAIPHIPVDVQALDCDAYAFSAHKMYGPTGIGVLWGKASLLDMLPPTRGGSIMIDAVSMQSATWAEVPSKFEPGTPAIAEAIGFGAAVEYLSSLPPIQEYEQALLAYLIDGLHTIPALQLIGTASPRCPLQSFHIPGCHPLDIASLLDLSSIAVRSGHLCCQPLLKKLSLTALTRVSLAFYNSFDDIQRFIAALERTVATLSI